jgi:hypothetical protein
MLFRMTEQRTQRRRGLGLRVLEMCVLSVAWIGGWVGIAQAMPVLSELYYDAPGSDDGFSFVEVAGIPGTSLEGLSIEGVNGSNGAVGPNIVLTGSIGASGLFVVADQTSAGTSGVPGADLFANFDFQNGPDSVVLRFGDTILDQLGYGDFAMDEVFAGEGMAAPDVAAGQSLARLFADLDTDNNVMDFAVSDIPTPGIASFLPIPEPGGAILLGLGLAGLGFGTRRCGSRPRR